MIHAIIYTLQEKKLNETFRFIFCWEESLAFYQAQSFLVGLYSVIKTDVFKKPWSNWHKWVTYQHTREQTVFKMVSVYFIFPYVFKNGYSIHNENPIFE